MNIDRAAWVRFATQGSRAPIRHSAWDDAEIIGALQAWADAHGRSPTWADWARSSPNHPAATTLRYHFATFEAALGKAKLTPQPAAPSHPRTWDHLDMVQALRDWTTVHGQPPASVEWLRAASQHPSTTTVRARYGSWKAALAAAGLRYEPATHSRNRLWPDLEILQALRDWTTKHGHPPVPADWLRGTPEHPSTGTTRKHFGSWQKALQAAALTRP